MTVHGIRTNGRWQKTLSEVLSQNKIQVKNFDFGYFILIKLLIPYYRTKMIEDFNKFYNETINVKSSKVNLKDHQKLPSVVAHSFGSYIIGWAMEKYSGIRFDKVILCGSILPEDINL